MINCDMCGGMWHDDDVIYKDKRICDECLFNLSQLYKEYAGLECMEFCPHCDTYFWCGCHHKDRLLDIINNPGEYGYS
jgi:hypothetical protein